MQRLAYLAALLATATPALASDGLDGAHMSLWWAAPFAGILLSIALGPLLAAHWWHPHYEKAAALWAATAIVPLFATLGGHGAAEVLFHALALEYGPFIVMLFALFTAAGGLNIRGGATGTPLSNTLILALGAAMASVIGTTGAAMILIRPLLRANADRANAAHVAVFFIFLVGNMGGALSPLGDPPLFLGFLRGVDFFWTTQHLFAPTLLSAGLLLALFFAIDSWRAARETREAMSREAFAVEGKINLALLAIAVAAIAMSGVWKPGSGMTILGVGLETQNLVRDAILVLVGLASLLLTDRRTRAETGFEWAPLIEVAVLFAAIFVCIAPVMAMLNAGAAGPFAPLVSLATRADGSPDNIVYFWLTGLLSAFLDNAPTYLVFFQMAGGDAARLMGPLGGTLAVISMGAVYMGALTYIGNAPNFMVYAIARDNGVRMPGFFGYMIWSFGILIPLFAALTFIFIR